MRETLSCQNNRNSNKHHSTKQNQALISPKGTPPSSLTHQQPLFASLPPSIQHPALSKIHPGIFMRLYTNLISSSLHYSQNFPRHLSPMCPLSPSPSVSVPRGDYSFLKPSYRVRAWRELILSCAVFALLGGGGIPLKEFLCGRPLL